jgi:hypothetical protein
LSLRRVDDPGVPLRRITLLGYGLRTLLPGGDIRSLTDISIELTLPALVHLSPYPLGLVLVRAGFGGDFSIIEGSPFSNASVYALSFIGMGISSSELSLSE